jgi:hypothetical protein
MVLVALGGYVASRFFGDRRPDADDDTQGAHPITRKLFAAANAGTMDDAASWVAAEFHAYVNGHEAARGEVDHGPWLLTEALRYYDQNVDDSFWELYAEVHEKVDGTHERLALRFVASGGYDGQQREIEVAAFLTVVDGMLTEMRWVTDLTTFNQMRVAAGMPALD